MQFPKTHLNDFISSDYDKTCELDDYTLFNNVCYKSSQAQVPTEIQVQTRNSDLCQSQDQYLQATREIIDQLSHIIKILKTVKCESEAQQRIFNNANRQFLILLKGLQIVNELLSNCKEQESKILLELKQNYVQERSIKAIKADDVNIRMLQVPYNYLQTDFLPKMQQNLKSHEQHMFASKSLTDEIKVFGTEILMLNLIMPSAIDTDKNDIMSLNSTHPVWKKLECITTRKSLGDPEQIRQSFDKFVQSVMVGHALVNDCKKNTSKWGKIVSVSLNSMYYFFSRSAAEKGMKDHMSQLKADTAYQAMNFIELPGVKHLINLGLPKIATNLKFYILPVVLPLTIQEANNQIRQGVYDQISNQPIEYVNQEIHRDDKFLFIKNQARIRIRLLYNQHVVEQDNIFSFLKSFFVQKNNAFEDKIIIHIHGGGFISQSSSSHQCYTREWSINLNVPIFSIDYSLAPQYPYPIPLDDCWQAYNWILNYSEKIFGIIPNKIIVTGDSAGGNLATALVGLTIKYKQQIPNGLILNYPAVDIRFQYTPSYLKSINDKILSHTILGICIESYSAHPDSQLGLDPFMSPLLLSYDILKYFPPTRLFCGDQDPLYDQVFRLAQRLQVVQKDVKITIYENLSHGYLNYNTIKGMSEIKQCILDNQDAFLELLN
ncbi:unnamed protein product [Paramecium sonneborni]|uniref:Alpha/beta hydrolase fold-3 domain-containing protein n=1 Tax=Paramecium sonneborni TaxID=65129 RepID=A0A8S1R3Z6_9CILI|nr:unnamed protein product [Paramecium sonneborni]